MVYFEVFVDAVFRLHGGKARGNVRQKEGIFFQPVKRKKEKHINPFLK